VDLKTVDLNTIGVWIGVGIAIFFGVVSFVIALRGRQKRELFCFFDAIEAPIEIKADDALKGDIKIYYEGQAVDNLFIVRANIVNKGTQSIRKSDVFEPLKFSFGHDVELLREPHVVKSVPNNLRLSNATESAMPGYPPSAAVVEFDLLNSKEEFTVEMLCTGRSQRPTPTCRVDGLSSIKTTTKEEFQRRVRRRGVLAQLPMILLILAGFVVRNVLKPGDTLLGNIIMICGVVGAFAFSYMTRKRLR
jgi:hypothetical protein